MTERRDTFTSRDLEAGCFTCRGAAVMWKGGNAQAVAARHHDTTRHATWCRIDMLVQYGDRNAVDGRQTDIEDAIASASSGDAPECAPLPDLDACTVAPAHVSAPVGRSSKPALAAAKPEASHA